MMGARAPAAAQGGMASVADDVARITQQQHMQRLKIEKIAREKQLEIWAAHWQQQGFSPEEIQALII